MLALSSLALLSSLVAPALAATFTVKVGADGKAFTPNFVNGQKGDVVVFEFHPKNHTLTQSTLANPCVPVPGGGSSGFVPVDATATTFPTKNLTIPDATTPLWFFCEQTGHCQSGMVFAINPGSQDKMNTFLSNAQGGTTTTPPPTTGGTGGTGGTGVPAPGPGTGTGTGTGTTPPTTGGSGQTITVTVGMGGTVFTPDRATANVGDTILFTFVGGNHTVTQSTFADPCTPMATGADSGFMPTAGTAQSPTFPFTVTDTSKPLWFFCRQANHCQSGMVFSLNAPATGNTADAFKQKAMGTGTGGSTPGGTGGSNGGSNGGNNGAASLTASALALLVATLVL